MGRDYFNEISGVVLDNKNRNLTEMAKTDPAARLIVDTYRQNFNNAVENMMTTNTGREIVNDIIKRAGKQIPKVSMVYSNEGAATGTSKNFIIWDFGRGETIYDKRGNPIGVISPTSALLHEFKHLLDPAYAVTQNSKAFPHADPFEGSKRVPEAEATAVDAENGYRAEIQGPHRNTYAHVGRNSLDLAKGDFSVSVGLSEEREYIYRRDKNGNIITDNEGMPIIDSVIKTWIDHDNNGNPVLHKAEYSIETQDFDGNPILPNKADKEETYYPSNDSNNIWGFYDPHNDPTADIDDDGIINRDDPDMDGDGKLNRDDDDANGNNIPDGDEDYDHDGVANKNDLDMDNDGLPNEIDPDADGNGAMDDIDGDGIFDYEDDDKDGDGIQNEWDADANGDGRIDDIDNDGIPNADDPDKDGDGEPNDKDDDPDGNGVPGDQNPSYSSHTCAILGAFAGGFAGGVAGGPLGAIIGAGVGAQHGAKACGEPDPWKPFFPPMALDPLSLDLNGDGKIGTLPLARGVHFDMDNSGFAEKLSWIAPEDGLLVNLADGATRVSNGSQLLGNETRLPSGELAADGFAALAALDDNGDGKVDAQDAAFAHLRVWQDKNSDGIASADELFALEALGIVSLATAYDATTWTDANGVEHRGEGAFAMKDAGGLMQTLWFTADKVDSVAVDVHHGTSAGLPEAVTRLPNAAGFGNVDTLHRAMNADADLRALVEAFVAESDPAARQALTEQILRRWAKADAVTGTRGALDARDLAVLEAFWGQPALAEQPTGAYARSVAQVYEGLKSLLHAQLSLQSHYREWYGLAQFRVQHGAWEINDTALADAIAQRFGAGSVNAATVGDFLDALQGLTPGNAALLQHLTVSVRQASAQLPLESRSALHEVIHRGDDHIALADGEDFVNAGAGNDRIDGNAGSNVIEDGAGNDTVHAGAGNDVLVSGSGDDSLDGGSGNDVYRIGGQSGHDTIHNVDNDAGRHDEIHLLDRDMTEVDISRVNNDLLIRSHDGDSSVTVRDHFNGAPVDAVRFSDDMVFDRAFLDKVARANSDPDYPDPTDWVENEQHDLDALLHRLAHGAAEDNHAGLSGWNQLLNRLTQDANSPSDIGDVDRLIEQMERGTAGKNATPPHQYDHHAHGTGGAHEHIDRLIDTWAGI